MRADARVSESEQSEATWVELWAPSIPAYTFKTPLARASIHSHLGTAPLKRFYAQDKIDVKSNQGVWIIYSPSLSSPAQRWLGFIGRLTVIFVNEALTLQQLLALLWAGV